MTIREELARQAGGRSMKTAITLMWICHVSHHWGRDNHFKIYLSFPCSGKVFAMMKALDEKIREEYPDVYKKVENKVVWTIRRSGYLLYYLGHFCMSLKEKKV